MKTFPSLSRIEIDPENTVVLKTIPFAFSFVEQFKSVSPILASNNSREIGGIKIFVQLADLLNCE